MWNFNWHYTNIDYFDIKLAIYWYTDHIFFSSFISSWTSWVCYALAVVCFYLWNITMEYCWMTISFLTVFGIAIFGHRFYTSIAKFFCLNILVLSFKRSPWLIHTCLEGVSSGKSHTTEGLLFCYYLPWWRMLLTCFFYTWDFVVSLLMISHNTDQSLNLRIGGHLQAMSHLPQTQ